MSVLKDPAIKLFGKTISLPPKELVPLIQSDDDPDPDVQSSSKAAVSEVIKNAPGDEEAAVCKNDDDSSNPAVEDLSFEPATDSGISDDQKISAAVADNETSSPKDEEKEDQADNSSSSQEKTLKKPDKILPCPRCNSMDTKFCYYNNYNVNQPRHFCKNCQRYWTAGGTMRNVPVGSGRRKNKNTCPSQYRHIMVSDALQAARGEGANGIHLQALKSNGTVLTFSSDRPLCESMATVLNLAERSKNQVPNGFHHGPNQRLNLPCGGIELAKDHASGISSTTSNSTEQGSGDHESVLRSSQGFVQHASPFPGPPWPFPWNSPQWRSPMPPTALGPSCFPLTFYPAPPYWGCAAPNPWNMHPWISQAAAPSSSDRSCMSTSSPTSPTLGKHTRDGNILNPSNQAKEEHLERKDYAERTILIPKTLRINDPNEAAKISIWSTLGIRNEKMDSINGATTLFKAFPSTTKGNTKNHPDDTSLVLQANPAAYSRSQCFHENTLST